MVFWNCVFGFREGVFDSWSPVARFFRPVYLSAFQAGKCRLWRRSRQQSARGETTVLRIWRKKTKFPLIRKLSGLGLAMRLFFSMSHVAIVVKNSPFWAHFWHIFIDFGLILAHFGLFLTYFDPFLTNFVCRHASAYPHMRIIRHESDITASTWPSQVRRQYFSS